VQGLSEVLSKALQKSKALTIEVSLAPPNYGDPPQSILSYGLLAKDNKIVLAQNGRRLR